MLDTLRIEHLKKNSSTIGVFMGKVMSLNGQTLTDFILNDQNWIDAFGTEIVSINGSTPAPLWHYERWSIPWHETMVGKDVEKNLKQHFSKLLSNT